MKAGLEQALQEWTAENPWAARIERVYQERLTLIFQKRQDRLNNPVFFLFLPYYVFWALVQEDEDDGNESRAFSLFMLHQPSLKWSVRSTPFKIYNASDLEHVQELYDLIEETLGEVLLEQKYNCVGKIGAIGMTRTKMRTRTTRTVKTAKTRTMMEEKMRKRLRRTPRRSILNGSHCFEPVSRKAKKSLIWTIRTIS